MITKKKWLFAKVVSIVMLISIVMTSNSIVAVAVTDDSSSNELVSGDYRYAISGGEAAITGYAGSAANVSIPDSIEGYPVRSIGGSAFEDCSSLVSINIPKGVTSIAWQAFRGCSSLTNINIPKGVTSIGWKAFEGCSSLTSISIPEGVTSIVSEAFSGCSNLIDISIPKGVTSIESETFSGCSSLTSISIPEGVTSIGNDAFYRCSNLTDISIPEGVTNIGWGAFLHCSSLTSISIPKGVTSIKLETFSSCSSLTSISIPEGVTSIGSGAFYHCSNLTDIHIPEGVTSIGSSAFNNCSNLTDVSIPEEVTSIGSGAFLVCSSLTSISIPKGVTSIESKTFADCSSLTSISIPEGVTSIGSGAFSGCSSLTSISIPEEVTSIGSESFEGCSSLTSISIPKGVTSIERKTFEDCSSLTSISIPEGVTSIESEAFSGCSNLTDIHIPEGVTSIESETFKGCSSLTSISIPKGVMSIESKAFSGCSNLTDIHIPEGVTSIGSYVFYGCSNLTDIHIPEGVTSIESFAFYGCSNLKSINIPERVTSIGWGAFYDCSSLISISIPDSVASIEMKAFSDCSSLTSINIPKSVTSIGYDAFWNSHPTIYGYTDSYAETYAMGNNISFMDIEGMESIGYDSYVVGTLSSVDALGGTVTIKGTAYEVSEDFDLSSATSILLGDCKTVIALKKDNMLLTLDSVKDVIQPKVELRATVAKAVYQNGAFDKPSFDLLVSESVDVQKPYSKSMLSNVDDAKITFSNLTLVSGENVAQISELDSSEKDYSLKVNLGDSIKPGKTLRQTYRVDIDDDYIPNSTNSTISFKATVESGAGEDVCIKTISVGNLDIASAKKQQNANITNTQNSLSNPSDLGIAVDVGFLSTYLSTTETQNIQRCISTWVADLVAVRSLITEDETGIIEKIKKQAKKSEDEMVLSVLSAVGINDGLLTKLTKSKASTQIITKDKNGQQVTLYISLDMGYYAFKDNAPYSGLGTITIYLEDASGKKHKNWANGMVTYADMSTFVNKLKSVAESSIKGVYDSAWGNNADKVAEIFVSETITKIMKNYGYSFSGGVFNLITKQGKTVRKSVGVHCPVDVYVYDSQQQLKGSIVNNEVALTDDELFLYVDGDEKYVYVMNDDYNFKLVGSDEGKMDYDITTYVDGEVERVIEYKDIPLQNNVTYYGYVPESVFSANLLYDLVAEDGNTLSVDSDSYEGTHQIFTESVSLDNENLELQVGDKKKLSATVLPTNTTNGFLEWTSSDEKIVIVDETTGEVEAIAEGTATITVTTLDGNSTQCMVEVLSEKQDSGDETLKPDGNEDTTTSPKPDGNITTNPKPTKNENITTIPDVVKKTDAKTNSKSTDEISTATNPSSGTVLKDTKNNVSYKVVKKGKTVALYKVNNKNVTKIVIPATVKIDGINYKVTAISNNAFKGCDKLKSVIIGKYVTKIGKKAFFGCKKLKSITIKSKALKNKSVGTKAFKGIHKKAVIKVPKKQKKTYSKWLKKKGISKTVKIR